RAHVPAQQSLLGGEHAAPHPPQCAADVVVSVSQPFDATPSQFPKPASHVEMTHAPLAQLALALATSQLTPQAPQFAGSLTRSKPSSVVPSQSSSTPLQRSVGTHASYGPASCGGATPSHALSSPALTASGRQPPRVHVSPASHVRLRHSST